MVAPAIAIGIPLALAAISVGGTLLAANEAGKAASAQKKANQIQQQGQQYEARRAQVQEFARQRRARAQALALAEATGVNSVGSSVTGGINSVISQSSGNQAFIGGQLRFANKAANQLNDASKANTRASQFGLLSQAGTTGLNIYGSGVFSGN